MSQPNISLKIEKKSLMPDGSIGCVVIGNKETNLIRLTFAQARTLIIELSKRIPDPWKV